MLKIKSAGKKDERLFHDDRARPHPLVLGVLAKSRKSEHDKTRIRQHQGEIVPHTQMKSGSVWYYQQRLR